jgi:hypothetical protein
MKSIEGDSHGHDESIFELPTLIEIGAGRKEWGPAHLVRQREIGDQDKREENQEMDRIKSMSLTW